MNNTVRLSEKHVPSSTVSPIISLPIPGSEFEIGDGFRALAFRDKDFSSAMDPLVLVDHYQMSEPTFGAHPHAGLSAISVIFEHSEGKLHNRDSLGNDFDILAGDLYWLKAGSGVVHDESPRSGANIHGLQVFVYLPAEESKSSPASLHVKAADIPILQDSGSRVRIVLGESHGIRGQQSPALPMTILDGYVNQNYSFSHQLNSDENAWIYVVEGEVDVEIGDKKTTVSSGHAIAISKNQADLDVKLSNLKHQQSHFTMFSSKPNNEDYVHKGPFVMSTEAEIALVEANFAAGKFGN